MRLIAPETPDKGNRIHARGLALAAAKLAIATGVVRAALRRLLVVRPRGSLLRGPGRTWHFSLQ